MVILYWSKSKINLIIKIIIILCFNDGHLLCILKADVKHMYYIWLMLGKE